MLFYKGDIAKEKAGARRDGDPAHAPDHVIRNKVTIAHLADTSDKWSKGPHDRDKASEHDRLAPMFVKKALCLLDMFFFNRDFGVSHQLLPEKVPDPVVDGVSENRRYHEESEQEPDVQGSERGEGASRKKQRVTGQEGDKDEPCLHKNSHKKDGIARCSIRRDQLAHVRVDMQEKIDDQS